MWSWEIWSPKLLCYRAAWARERCPLPPLLLAIYGRWESWPQGFESGRTCHVSHSLQILVRASSTPHLDIRVELVLVGEGLLMSWPQGRENRQASRLIHSDTSLAQIQGSEFLYSNIYLIFQLLKCMKGPVLLIKTTGPSVHRTTTG